MRVVVFACILISAYFLLGVNCHHHIYHHEGSGHRSRQNGKEFFDLGYTINEDTIFFPGQRDFSLSKDYDGVNKSGLWYSAFSFCMGEHGGTHVDAPFHFYKEGWTLDKIPQRHLVDVPAAVIDVEEVVQASEDPSQFSLEVRHLVAFENENGEIPRGGVALIYTGWSKFWPDKIKYLGWSNETNEGASNVNFPGISENAAKWLANERQIVGLGVDTSSVDVGTSQTYPVHIFLAQRQIYNIENVANLHLIPKSSCSVHLFVLPMKIVGATGGPARILAYCK